MKKQIITGIAVIACVALCAAVWPRSVKWVEDLLTEPVKTAVIGEIEARSEEMPPIFLSDDMPLNRKLSQKVNKRKPI